MFGSISVNRTRRSNFVVVGVSVAVAVTLTFFVIEVVVLRPVAVLQRQAVLALRVKEVEQPPVTLVDWRVPKLEPSVIAVAPAIGRVELAAARAHPPIDRTRSTPNCRNPGTR